MSPQLYARICGVLYVYILVAGTFAALFVRSKLVVSRDAAATAANIMAGESLFRLGFSAELLHLACDVAVAMLLYALLRPVDRNIALLAAFMRLASDLILATAGLSHFAAGTSWRARRSEDIHRISCGVCAAGHETARRWLCHQPECPRVRVPLLGHRSLLSATFPGPSAAPWPSPARPYLHQQLRAHLLHPATGAALFNAGILVRAFVVELVLTLWLLVEGVNVAPWDGDCDDVTWRRLLIVAAAGRRGWAQADPQALRASCADRTRRAVLAMLAPINEPVRWNRCGRRRSTPAKRRRCRATRSARRR